MALTMQEIEAVVLSWPEDSRRHLLDVLENSLPAQDEDSEDFSPAYLAELDRRSDQIRRGEAVLVSYDDAMKRISEVIKHG